MTTQNKFIQSLFDPDDFTITYELVPGQGSMGKQVDRLLGFANQAAQDGRVKALSITDNPGGHPALAPIAIGSEVQKLGIDPLLHFSLKDKNRNQVESHLFLYHRQQFENLLVLGGDFPRPSYHGQAKPVFDIDTIQTLQLIRDMENGSYQRGPDSKRSSFAPIHFNSGCVVSPFKMNEAEQVWQYAKLLQKTRAGADFVITQLGFDTCKYEELMLFMRENGLTVPVLGNIFVPSLPVARYMAKGRVPGVVLSDELITTMEKEQEGKDRQARLLRAAKMICILKGIGYSGIHLGGNNLTFDDVGFILDTAKEMEPSWNDLRTDVHYPLPGTWYYYQQTGPGTCGDRKVRLNPGRKYRDQKIHSLVHTLLFVPPNLTSRLFGRFCRFCDRSRIRTAILRFLEKTIKHFLFYCKMCGDCTLSESTYICPQSGCPKNLLNGPCGGSRDMSCEVYPDRYCFWVRVYNRVEPETTVHQLGQLPVMLPKNWALDQTSSWINYYTGKDHCKLTFQR